MILTGKARNDFNVWCMDKGFENFNPKDYSLDIAQAVSNAVVIIFFDSVGITVDVMPLLNSPLNWIPNTFCIEKNIDSFEENEYLETRNQAIKKANEIYNTK